MTNSSSMTKAGRRRSDGAEHEYMTPQTYFITFTRQSSPSFSPAFLAQVRSGHSGQRPSTSFRLDSFLNAASIRACRLVPLSGRLIV